MPYAFLLPAIGLIALMLLYPTIQTINYAFANADSTEYVGLENFRDHLQRRASSGRRSPTTSCGC